MTEKSALVAIANGSEELEAIATIDILRRSGVNVVVASVSEKQVKCSRGVNIVADVLIDEAKDRKFDVIALPGGMPGSTNLAENETLTKMLKEQALEDRIVAAICAAPAVCLEPLGMLKGNSATCHPAFQDKITDCSMDRVVVSKNDKLVTSRGPGTAVEFALKIVELLWGKEKEREVAKPMITHL